MNETYPGFALEEHPKDTSSPWDYQAMKKAVGLHAPVTPTTCPH
jgi:hypothetical protein